MADPRISENTLQINARCPWFSAVTVPLSKAYAMATIATGSDFLDYEPNVISDYLWALHGLIKQAQDACYQIDVK